MENLSTIIICVILAAICIFAVSSYRKKLKHGCCGGEDDIKIKPAETRKSQYPYKATVFIDGMTCAHCAARIENAFHEKEGYLAKVHLSNKRAELWTMQPPQQDEIRRIIEQAGYTFEKLAVEK